MTTGFFRVTIAKRKDNEYFKYQIRNRIVNDSLLSKNILDLKRKVIEKGYLWGITDLNKAKKTAEQNNIKIKDLQGKHGLQINN